MQARTPHCLPGPRGRPDSHHAGRRQPGSKGSNKELGEAPTTVETPLTVLISIVGCVETPRGLHTFETLFADHISLSAKGAFTRTGRSGRRKAFRQLWQHEGGLPGHPHHSPCADAPAASTAGDGPPDGDPGEWQHHGWASEWLEQQIPESQVVRTRRLMSLA